VHKHNKNWAIFVLTEVIFARRSSTSKRVEESPERRESALSQSSRAVGGARYSRRLPATTATLQLRSDQQENVELASVH